MFVQALEQISKKINQSKKKEDGYKILEKKIINNPILKNQFEVYTELFEHANKINTNCEFKKFFIAIKEKCTIFKPEEIDTEVTKLLEFFNINPQNIKPTIMDKAMQLNESALKSVVVNTKKKLIKETYQSILKTENENELRKQFQIINFNCQSILDESRKLMIKQSLHSLLAEKYKNYEGCIKKLYKLRMLTEKILSEGPKGPEQEKSQYGGGKNAKIGNLSFLKNITIETPSMYKKPEKIIFKFKIPFYPIGATTNAARTSAIRIMKKLNRLERLFVNSCIYQNNMENFFDPIGTIWEVNLNPQTQPGRRIVATIEIYLNTNASNDGINTWENFKKAGVQVMKEFNNILPDLMGELKDTLTSSAQKDSISKVKGLSKAEKQQMAKQHGDVDQKLIMKHIAKKDSDEALTRVDDFSGAF